MITLLTAFLHPFFPWTPRAGKSQSNEAIMPCAETAKTPQSTAFATAGTQQSAEPTRNDQQVSVRAPLAYITLTRMEISIMFEGPDQIRMHYTIEHDGLRATVRQDINLSPRAQPEPPVVTDGLTDWVTMLATGLVAEGTLAEHSQTMQLGVLKRRQDAELSVLTRRRAQMSFA